MTWTRTKCRLHSGYPRRIRPPRAGLRVLKRAASTVVLFDHPGPDGGLQSSLATSMPVSCKKKDSNCIRYCADGSEHRRKERPVGCVRLEHSLFPPAGLDTGRGEAA